MPTLSELQPMTQADRLVSLIGVAAHAAARPIRVEHPIILRRTHISYEMIMSTIDSSGLTRGERALAAWRVATISRSDRLAAQYLSMVDPNDPALASLAPSPRLAAILAHVDRITMDPAAATSLQVEIMRGVGLTNLDIMALAQIVAQVGAEVRAGAEPSHRFADLPS